MVFDERSSKSDEHWIQIDFLMIKLNENRLRGPFYTIHPVKLAFIL